MAIIQTNPLIKSISGTVGDGLTIRTVGDTTILSAKPSRPRKRSRKPRSPRQLEQNKRFGQAARDARRMNKIPEVNAYFSTVSVGMGGANNAYTALVRLLRNKPELTEEKVLELVRTTRPEESVGPSSGRLFCITGPNGDIIAQGVARPASNSEWTYTSEFSGIKVMIKDLPV
jgi:hypothetical protein